MFTNSRLKTASPTAIGLHPVLRIFGTHVKVVVNRFFFWCRHREFVVHVFLNVIDHVYAILKQCYLFHRLSMPCPTLLRIIMQKSFFLRHDFKALMQKLSKKDFFRLKIAFTWLRSTVSVHLPYLGGILLVLHLADFD